MIPKRTKAFFGAALRHPLFFAALYIPAIISVIAACVIYRPHPAFILPLGWCFFVGSFLIEGISDGKLTDNQGTALRQTMPVRFWGKVTIWGVAYIFALIWSIGFAIQEENKHKTEQPVAPYSEPATRFPKRSVQKS